MSNRLSGVSSLAYQGTNAASPPNVTVYAKAPTPNDYKNFSVGDFWIYKRSSTTNDSLLYVLLGITSRIANWSLISIPSGNVCSLTGNNNLPVYPDAMANINVVGDNTSISILGNPATSSLTASVIPGGLGSITLNNGDNITVTGSPVSLGGTATISVSGTTNNSLQIGNSSGGLTSIGVASNGQIPIGSTGSSPVLSTLTAGTGIAITNGAGSIMISAADETLWSIITADQTALVFNGYFCNKVGTLRLELPVSSNTGDIIEISNENNATGVQIIQRAGQQILIGQVSTTVGVTGTLTSSSVGDTLKIVCYVPNFIWRVTEIIGNWTPF